MMSVLSSSSSDSLLMYGSTLALFLALLSFQNALKDTVSLILVSQLSAVAVGPSYACGVVVQR